ncbi:MAG: Crp/Fnr family transcriptional regulator [Devosia sp.]
MQTLLDLLGRRHALSPEDLEPLRMAVTHIATYERGEELVGNDPDALHYVVDGWFYEAITLMDGRWIICRFSPRGDVVNARRLWEEGWAGSIVSLGGRIATVDRRALARALEHDRLRLALAQRHRFDDEDTVRALVSAIGGMAMERLAGLFFRLFLKAERADLVEGGSFEFPGTQAHVAAATGLSQVHVNRCLQEFRKRAIMDWQGGRIVIKQWEALRALAMMDDGGRATPGDGAASGRLHATVR